MATSHPQIAGLADWAPLARGGFATVWKARQVTLDRPVAVKIDQRTLDAEKEQRRFLREAGAAGRLSGHPGIVTVHDAGILPDDRPYLVMELCPGGSLTAWLKPDQRPSERRVRDVGVRIADALAAAHARGVLHRDVKPANILIDAYNNPGLADFGLAALPEPGAELSVTMEALTPAYAPREVFYQQPPNEFGDVFSLAATLYALLDGRPPRWPDDGSNPSLPEILELQQHPVERIPGVTPELMDVILRALADRPEDRPTAAQFRDQLAALDLPATDGDRGRRPPVTAHVDRAPKPGGDGGGRRRRGDRTLLVVAAVLIVLALAGAGAAVWLRSTKTPQPVAVPVGSESPTSTPSPTPSATPSPTASESPTRSASPSIPPGFVSCFSALGEDNYCAVDRECWNNYQQFFDILAFANPASCKRRHLYQTFAAGMPSRAYSSQSQLTQDPQAKKLCSTKTLEKVLDRSIPGYWQIKMLPPPLQLAGDPLFRCIVSTNGMRSKPLKLKDLH